jgi:hypothetical protein
VLNRQTNLSLVCKIVRKELAKNCHDAAPHSPIQLDAAPCSSAQLHMVPHSTSGLQQFLKISLQADSLVLRIVKKSLSCDILPTAKTEGFYHPHDGAGEPAAYARSGRAQMPLRAKY